MRRLTTLSMTALRAARIGRVLLALCALVVLVGAAAAQDERPGDPYRNYKFRVEIEGIATGDFSLVSGLEATTEVFEYRTGGEQQIRKLPGRTHYANIILRRGYTGSAELWDWHARVIKGGFVRRAGSIILLNRSGDEVERYNFFEAWPRRYRTFALDANYPEVLVEEIELAIEWFERAG